MKAPGKVSKPPPSVAWACAHCGKEHFNADKIVCKSCNAKRAAPLPAPAPAKAAVAQPGSASASSATTGPPCPGVGPTGGDSRAAAVAALLAAGIRAPEDLLQIVAPASPAERVSANACPTVPDVGRAETIREMNVLEGLLKKRRADIVRSNMVIADAQRQLPVAQKAIDVMEANLCRLAATMGPAASDGELAHGGDRDLASVLSDVRHITETLGKVGRLTTSTSCTRHRRQNPSQRRRGLPRSCARTSPGSSGSTTP